jgi:hypothetical protein
MLFDTAPPMFDPPATNCTVSNDWLQSRFKQWSSRVSTDGQPLVKKFQPMVKQKLV